MPSSSGRLKPQLNWADTSRALGVGGRAFNNNTASTSSGAKAQADGSAAGGGYGSGITPPPSAKEKQWGAGVDGLFSETGAVIDSRMDGLGSSRDLR
jgi:hypothetical protein